MMILVNLIKNHISRGITGPNIFQSFIYNLNLFFKARMTYIYYMKQQVSFTDFIKGRFKRFDEAVWQLAYKTNCIRNQERKISDSHLPDSSIKGCKKLIFLEDFSFAENIHQRGFSNVGVAYESNTHQLAPVFALSCFLLVNFGQLFFQPGNLVTHDTSVCFNLPFTGASCPNSTPLSLQVSPH